MARKHIWVILVLWTCILSAGCLKNVSSGSGTPKMSREELKAMLGQPDVVILDVRIDDEWKKSQWMIKGAIHENPEEFKKWYSKYPKDKTLVFYCS